jgi:hypothetical protein
VVTYAIDPVADELDTQGVVGPRLHARQVGCAGAELRGELDERGQDAADRQRSSDLGEGAGAVAVGDGQRDEWSVCDGPGVVLAGLTGAQVACSGDFLEGDGRRRGHRRSEVTTRRSR